MSDTIKHECGIAMVRLLKPLNFYLEKYGTALYGLNKLYLLMEKQHNRGQDGAGVASIKLNLKPGNKYIDRKRSNSSRPVHDIFEKINNQFYNLKSKSPEKLNSSEYLKYHTEFVAELYLGHLRYGTFGGNDISHCHPFVRRNNWMTKNLVLAGNFNLTNNDELFDFLVSIGQHPKEKSDTVTVLEKIGHYLDVENERLFEEYKSQGCSYQEISPLIANNLDIQDVLYNSALTWDGGYVMAGMIGHGDAFALRDPNGIRPAFYYYDDEIVVVTSERPAIQTAFNLPYEKIKELKPGYALIIKKDGHISEKEYKRPLKKKACSFERIYFSRGSDADIYKERKTLGRLICPAVLKEVDYDINNTVISYIPNTAEVAYMGLLKGVEEYLNEIKFNKIREKGDKITDEELKEILSLRFRMEKIAIKDAKLRTFITDDLHRNDLVAHVYDITYGAINENIDNLIIIDDSIVRGTTLKNSILKILDRLGSKQIVVVSSAPQIRYPDCYGIDMARLDNFIAFQAAISLLKENDMEHLITETYNKCIEQENLPKREMINCVKDIYMPFTADEISEQIAKLLTPSNMKSKVKIIYQTLENLHAACPLNNGDWYFSGNYPTPGGNKVVNRAFINYVEGKFERAYS